MIRQRPGTLPAAFATAVIAALLLPVEAQASESCSESVGLWGASTTCVWSFSEYQEASGVDEHTWVVTLQCGNGGICSEQVECAVGDAVGFMHDVYMDSTDVGDVCLPDEAVDQVSIGQLVIREFKRISWPSSVLTVQPPGGGTLVNLETIFFTTNATPSTRELRVAGRNVSIEAAPSSYTWDFGDQTSTTTTSAGHPYPEHDVFHVYGSTGKVEARVDTTYSGRFRIGDGEWQSIPDTLTVPGQSVRIDILEATPQLVIR